MSSENFFTVSEEVKKFNVHVEEKKIFNKFYKVFNIDAPLTAFPLSIAHSIEDLNLAVGEFSLISGLRVDNFKALHVQMENLSIEVNASTLTIYTEEKGERVKGNIIFTYEKDSEFELSRTVRLTPRTEKENFPNA
jgi:hypothetical protein